MKYTISILLILLCLSVGAQTDKHKSILDSIKTYQELEEVSFLDQSLDPYKILDLWIQKNITYNLAIDTAICYRFSYIATDASETDTLATADGGFVIQHRADKILIRNLLKDQSIFTSINYKEHTAHELLKNNYIPEMSIAALFYYFNIISDDHRSMNNIILRKYSYTDFTLNKQAATNQFLFKYLLDYKNNPSESVQIYFNQNKLLDSVVADNRFFLIRRNGKKDQNIYSRLVLRHDVESGIMYAKSLAYTYHYATNDHTSSIKVKLVANIVDSATAASLYDANIYQKKISILLPMKKAYERTMLKSRYDNK